MCTTPHDSYDRYITYAVLCSTTLNSRVSRAQILPGFLIIYITMIIFHRAQTGTPCFGRTELGRRVIKNWKFIRDNYRTPAGDRGVYYLYYYSRRVYRIIIFFLKFSNEKYLFERKRFIVCVTNTWLFLVPRILLHDKSRNVSSRSIRSYNNWFSSGTKLYAYYNIVVSKRIISFDWKKTLNMHDPVLIRDFEELKEKQEEPIADFYSFCTRGVRGRQITINS